MEELQARHRKEQRDLVAKITQKKKQASKKTRKGVNDECDILERELKERQAREIAEVVGDTHPADGTGDNGGVEDEELAGPEDATQHEEVEAGLKELSISSSPTANGATAGSQEHTTHRKPNRAKARLARRAAEQEALVAQAAEEAANMPDLKELERKKMHEEFKRRGLQEKIIRADGHCLYSAVADQLETLDLDLKPKIKPSVIDSGQAEQAKLPAYKQVRQAAASYMQQHPDDFVPFLEEPLEDYVHKVSDTGEWGGQLELLALAKTYGLGINVIQGDGRLETIESGAESDKDRSIWLAYYRHGFGLGEHYNSLRRIS